MGILHGGMKRDRKKKKPVLLRGSEMGLHIGGIRMAQKKALRIFQTAWG
jgi:hypothetical protein